MFTSTAFSSLDQKARTKAAKGVYDIIDVDDTVDTIELVVQTFVQYVSSIVKTDTSISFLYNGKTNLGAFTAKDFQVKFSFDLLSRSIEFGREDEALFYGRIPLDCFEELNTLLQYGLKEESLPNFLDNIVFELHSLTKKVDIGVSYCVAKDIPLFSNYFVYFNSLKRQSENFHKFSMFETKLIAVTKKLLEDAFSNVAFEITETIWGLDKAMESSSTFVEYMEVFYENGINPEYIFTKLAGKGFLGFTEDGDLMFDETSGRKSDYETAMHAIKLMCIDCFWVGRNCSLEDFFPLLERLQKAVKEYTEKHSKTVALYKETMKSLNPDQEPLLNALHKIENLVTFSGSPKDLRLEWHTLYDTIAYSLPNIVQPKTNDNV